MTAPAPNAAPAPDAAGAAAYKRPFTKIDWKRGARLLAGGADAGDVATALGIDEDRLWRHLGKSTRFRFLLAQAVEQRQGLCALQAGPAAAQMIRDAALHAGPAEPEAMRVVQEARQTPAPDSAKAVAALGESAGRRPPNAARMKRLVQRQADIDVQAAGLIAVAEVALAKRAAETAAAAAAKPDEPKRTQTNTNEPKRSETIADKSPSAPESYAGGDDGIDDGDAPDTRLRGPRPWLGGAIIDLPDQDGQH